MKNYLAILFILLIFILKAQSQSMLPPCCYMRLEGKMDPQTNMIMHLVKVNDSLYGDCNSGLFSGKITPKGKFSLTGGEAEHEVEIKGQFKDRQHVTVTWEIKGDKIKKFTFDMIDKFPEGSTPLRVFFETGSKKISKDPKSPKASVKLALLAPQITENHPSGIDTLNRSMLNSFSESGDLTVEPESAETIIETVKKEFLDNYISSNETMYKEMPGASFEWELLKFTHIIYNDDSKLTYYILNYTFTGGAHGLETQIYNSIDIKSGKTLSLGDLLKPGYENKLTGLLTDKLHQMLKLPALDKLTESGYFTDEVKPNDNFYLTRQGIGFYYNHYEIAPYSFGATNIFLTRDELKGLLKKP